MSLTLEPDVLPLKMDETGTVRVSGTRVRLDTIVGCFNQGDTPQDLAESFPGVPLADIYSVIAFYLHHREAVDAYLAERERQAAELRRQVEARQGPQPTREELLARLQRRNAQA